MMFFFVIYFWIMIISNITGIQIPTANNGIIDGKIETKSDNVVDDVVLSVVNCDRKAGSFILKNMSDHSMNYEKYYSLEKLTDAGWTDVKINDNVVHGLYLYILKTGDEVELNVSFDAVFGELTEGKYRISIPVDDGKVCTEFEV